MVDYKIILGGIASVIILLSCIPYFRDVFKGATKPHIFSWFIWGLLGSVTYAAQIIKGAGAGAWANGVEALICFVIASLAISRGEKNITLTDRLALGGAILTLVLWVLTKNPLAAVILAVIVDGLAYFPTFRKVYYKPHEETVVYFLLNTVSMILSLFALEAYNATTWLYPVYLVLINSAFISMSLIRRKIIDSRRIV